jgi:two-component system, OmpR family, sensor histidine kinase ResE
VIQARREKPDLVVIDLGLPGIDGLDVARTLRRQRDTPIIMLTARIEDTGSGIAPEPLQPVFDRFYHGDKSRGRAGGAGLGLAIARQPVAAHSGQIEVASPPGAGTTFTITLPVKTMTGL